MLEHGRDCRRSVRPSDGGSAVHKRVPGIRPIARRKVAVWKSPRPFHVVGLKQHAPARPVALQAQDQILERCAAGFHDFSHADRMGQRRPSIAAALQLSRFCARWFCAARSGPIPRASGRASGRFSSDPSGVHDAQPHERLPRPPSVEHSGGSGGFKPCVSTMRKRGVSARSDDTGFVFSSASATPPPFVERKLRCGRFAVTSPPSRVRAHAEASRDDVAVVSEENHPSESLSSRRSEYPLAMTDEVDRCCRRRPVRRASDCRAAC